MKVIIIGAHTEAKQLINRISAGWDISVIDMDQDKLRNFNVNRQIEKYQGDGTSTLVLKKAGIENSSAVITLTESDEVNIEILKIAKQNNILRLSSVINDEAFTNKYKELDVELVDPGTLIARRLEHILEPRRVVSQAFAGGMAEAIELEINADSPARGKTLKDIGSDYYIVGAILRKGEVLIPHGDTELQTGDLVTVVLQSGAFGNVIELFSGSESRFPLEFGKNVAVIVNSEEHIKNLSESEFYTVNTKAEQLILFSNEAIFSDSKETNEETFNAILKDQEFQIIQNQKNTLKEIENRINELSIGTIVVPIVEDNPKKSYIKSLISLSNNKNIPVLFSRGSSPYQTIGILANNNFSENSPTLIGFDLAVSLSAKIVALKIDQPKFLTQENPNLSRQIIDKLQDIALSHEAKLEVINSEGNEAKTFIENSNKFDLSIVGKDELSGWQSKKISEYVCLNSNSSVLYIPN